MKKRPMHRKEISSFISQLERQDTQALKKLEAYFSQDSFRKTVCFTGPAGVGKSTLIASLFPFLPPNQKIAWLACDPTSPVSGGSLLGDRIRLSGYDIHKNHFVRSLATRGTSAFSRAIRDMEVFLEHFFDEVWVETAGIGQTQIEVTSLSAITVLLFQPETGDEIQWMKSGLREKADLFVINKSDLLGAEAMVQCLKQERIPEGRIFMTSAFRGEGLKNFYTGLQVFQKNMKWFKRCKELHQKYD